MISGSHILFSKIIYEYCTNKLNIKLNRGVFMYGNIKPDISKECKQNEHSVEDSADIVKVYYAKLTSGELENREFSLILGMMCHYICDFFCIFHTKEYVKKNSFVHTLYEIRLHMVFIARLLGGKIKITKFKNLPYHDIETIISVMRERYFKEIPSFTRDINNALEAAIWSVESAVYYRKAEEDAQAL
ncbi:zinc dependent phospholipase C family protein [Clostridium sp. 19966]|uniref:zinc dependent phospholipase C family protein n=1 Tax=Clostridium sp. 19966 TaxID=2768166 RepID=UPI0028E09114|nr:zinc dependent phospholipase C family protein [Clostridium sp. 19966]MDT8718329.1 zinc dependent phospholipase C family protein [Clostridium sp. 19966]